MKRKIGTALVAGAGISGIRAALDLAECGYGVTLIDRCPHIGGILSQLDYQFPTDRCGMCKMLPSIARDDSSQYCLRKGLFHENIEIRLSTEIISLEGEPGHFKVMLRGKPGLISHELCTGCGACTAVCPVEVPDEFNEGLSLRKAVYLPVPHAIPNTYVIDTDACTRCGACEEACPTAAIRLSQGERRQFHILVVDDELIVRDSLKEWLEDEGFSVDMAESGPEALEQLANCAYHLMLADIKMTGMDGVELLKKAKEALPDLCVVMMTAYATVETAVEAMKIGALDYLIKPFDPNALISMVLRIYQDFETGQGHLSDFGAVVLCGGAAYFNPAESKNPFGYGVLPNVITSLEFERILSGTGPCQGKLVRPSDGKAIRKAAWIQCVGSRDLQTDADFCSDVCCMYAIKECLLAREKAEGEIETTIFYMDMRTFGKSFQRYRDQAENEQGVRFERGRIHSVIQDKEDNEGNLILHYSDRGGALHDESYDMVILAVGQLPAAGMAELAEMLKIPLNPWGFAQSEPFSLTQTGREGILLGGSFSGLKDIGESVTQASAAALSASRVIHAAGGSQEIESDTSEYRDVSRDYPKILVLVCTCGNRLSASDPQEIVRELEKDPAVFHVEFLGQTCTAEGWDRLAGLAEKYKPNRILIAACLSYIYARKLRELARQIGLNPALTEAVSYHQSASNPRGSGNLLSLLRMGIARLRHADPSPVLSVPVCQEALVVGGGIAGMTAALAVADHGFQVYLIEQAEVLGGNLRWLQKTIEGYEIKTLLDDTRMKVEKHPRIQVHIRTRVIASYGQVGSFFTTVQDEEGLTHTLEHGVTVLATGGTEAAATSYGYGTSSLVVTQKELEQKLAEKSLDPKKLAAVVMIQCVGSREEPRNYCSRVCCASALKHALYLKSQNPDMAIYVLYRDMMSYGFAETYFTQARKAGVIFIQYEVKEKPRVKISDQSVYVTVFDPILGSELEIESDLLVLATGIVPALPEYIVTTFGASVDRDGFFQEAESKWRPVDSLKEGVFGCGIAHSPRSAAESVISAEAAAQRALRILSYKQLPGGKFTAKVRHSLCSLCERCIAACPYGARVIDTDSEKIQVNPVMCQGCGSCAAVCPNSASFLEGYSIRQMLEVVDAAFA